MRSIIAASSATFCRSGQPVPREPTSRRPRSRSAAPRERTRHRCATLRETTSPAIPLPLAGKNAARDDVAGDPAIARGNAQSDLHRQRSYRSLDTPRYHIASTPLPATGNSARDHVAGNPAIARRETDPPATALTNDGGRRNAGCRRVPRLRIRFLHHSRLALRARQRCGLSTHTRPEWGLKVHACKLL